MRQNITLEIRNQHTTVEGGSKKQLQAIDKVTSYPVEGARFASSYGPKRWDGKEHLFKFSRVHGYRFPTGLLAQVVGRLRKIGADIVVTDKREEPERVVFGWNKNWKLRDYQREAVESVMAGKTFRGTGILKMPPRSGKTITAARIIHNLGMKAIVLVPDKWLLYQTRDKLAETLGCRVGMIGDGRYKVEDVTVSTFQSLDSRRKSKAYKSLTNHFGLLIADEVHHLKGDIWHKIVQDFSARYRIGLSATAYPDLESENSRGVIWLTACCGPIRIDISTSQLIEAGWLMRPCIQLYRIEKPNMEGWPWGPSLLRQAIHQNDVRNRRILQLVRQFAKDGLKILIITSRTNHTRLIRDSLRACGVSCHELTGRTSSGARRLRVRKFVAGEVAALVGTIFGEGVDIPEIEVVINAEGGRDVKATVQRMRNLTLAEGKKGAVFVDFLDLTNPYLAEHSLERLRTYREERAFDVRIAD